MSTKKTLKHHDEKMEGGIGGFHLYRECFDEDDTYIYLEVSGVPFEAASSACLDSGKGLSSIAFRLPEEWACKLGLIERGATHDEQKANAIGKPDRDRL